MWNDAGFEALRHRLNQAEANAFEIGEPPAKNTPEAQGFARTALRIQGFSGVGFRAPRVCSANLSDSPETVARTHLSSSRRNWYALTGI